jgi:hypothetical protein
MFQILLKEYVSYVTEAHLKHFYYRLKERRLSFLKSVIKVRQTHEILRKVSGT